MAETADQLAWEKQNRSRAAALCIACGVLTIGTLVVSSLVSSDQPHASLLNSLHALEQPGAIGGETSTRVALYEYLHKHTGLVLLPVPISLGLLAAAFPLFFLARATAARRSLPKFAIPLTLSGLVVTSLALVITSILQVGFYGDKIDGPHTIDAFSATSPTNSAAFGIIAVFGLFAFALGLVITALNAMRAGLLTRTMGILGMAAAGLTVVSLNPTQPLFPLWCAFLAPLFLGRWMGGQPPAWVTGDAEPWPSSAQVREQRQKARGGAQLADPDPEPVESRAGTPHPSSKKRKRKKRN